MEFVRLLYNPYIQTTAVEFEILKLCEAVIELNIHVVYADNANHLREYK